MNLTETLVAEGLGVVGWDQVEARHVVMFGMELIYLRPYAVLPVQDNKRLRWGQVCRIEDARAVAA